MKLFDFIILVFLSGCATKYILPGNRFITPETQGSIFLGQIEYQQAGANQLIIDTSNGTVDAGVLYEDVIRSGFLMSNSLFDSFDFVWSHTGGGNSMLGGKLQFLGGSRSGNAAGHKGSLAILAGGNDYETDDKTIKFNLGGTEYLALYGFRLNPAVLTYSSFSYATYEFKGIINSSDPTLDGLTPGLQSQLFTLSGGLELTYSPFITKLEASYQQLQTSDSKDKSSFIFGYSFGFNW
jgi:hypothetical protein